MSSPLTCCSVCFCQYAYDHGGRSFWIHNTGPFGCLPYMLELPKVKATQLDKAGCSIPLNEAAQFFNHQLKEAVIQLRKQLPLAAITYVDVYSVKYSLITQAKKHGKPFTHKRLTRFIITTVCFSLV